MKRIENRPFLMVLMAAASLGSGGEAARAADESAANADDLREVVVTARRREEDIQKVPISMQALSSGEMEKRNMESITDVVAQTPNVFTTNYGPAGDSHFSIRGIPNVGFFVDGIWQQSTVLLNERSTVELERVEVLRGPQGTLFGRDSSGGAIRVYTKAPAPQFGARVTATIGSFDRLDLGANVDIPVTDTLLTKWTIGSQKSDGYDKSLTVDRSYGEIDDSLLRGDVLWMPADRFSFRLTGELSKQQTTEPTGTLFVMTGQTVQPALGYRVPPNQYYVLLGHQFDNLSLASGYPGGRVGEWQTMSNFNQGHGIVADTRALTATAKYKVNDYFSLMSLTGFHNQYNRRYSDFDSSQFDDFEQQQWNHQQSLTQEFQLTGSMRRVNWVAGLFGWRTTNKDRQFRWGQTDIDAAQAAQILASPQCQLATPGLAPCRVPGYPNNEQFTLSAEKGYAVFGEVNINITDALTLTVGGRHHYQRNDISTAIAAPDAPTRAQAVIPGQVLPGDYLALGGTTNPQSVSFDANTFRYGLSYQFTETLMGYFTYSQGFDSGGLSQATVQDANNKLVNLVYPFAPERIRNKEAGLRSDWLQNRLRVNLSAFLTDWLDMQERVQLINPFTGQLTTQGITQNVAKSRAKGVELSVNARPTRDLSFDFSAATLNTGYLSIQPGVTSVHLGDKFGMAPKFQYTLGAQWHADLGGHGSVLTRVDYAWTDAYNRSYATDSQASSYNSSLAYDQKAFGLLNARVTYTSPKGQWELAAFGTNLTNSFYVNGGFDPVSIGMDYSSFGPPREFGLSLKLFLGAN